MSDEEEISHLQQLIDIYKRNIFQIEREEAMHGLSSPINVTHQLETYRRKLRETQDRLHVLLSISDAEEKRGKDQLSSSDQEIDDKVVYASYTAAAPALQMMYLQSKTIKILTSNGRTDLAHGSVFYNAIGNRTDAKVYILLASPDSYYVSSEWAAKQNVPDPEGKAQLWQERINRTVIEIRRKYRDLDIQFRTHKLPFTWRIWIGDQTVFVSSRLSASGNDIKMPVFQFTRSTHPTGVGMFEMFETYFDRTWEDASAES